MSMKNIEEILRDFNTGASAVFEAFPLIFEKATGYKIDRVSGRSVENEFVYRIGVIAGTCAYAAGLAMNWQAIMFSTIVINATNFANTIYISIPNQIRRQEAKEFERKLREMYERKRDWKRLQELFGKSEIDYITGNHKIGNGSEVIDVDFEAHRRDNEERRELFLKTYKSPKV